MRKAEPLQVWLLRSVNVLAIVSGIVLLAVDSPIPTHLPKYLTHAVVEAAPLLLVGFAFLAWLVIDRPAISDFIKQGFIALAFILWGVDLLMPDGRAARFVGAVVIAIYVFGLAWLMEGNLRKKFTVRIASANKPCTSAECRAGGVCGCQNPE